MTSLKVQLQLQVPFPATRVAYQGRHERREEGRKERAGRGFCARFNTKPK